MENILVCGAGGFIGGHLVKSLLSDGYKVKCIDIKPKELWFQYYENCENFSLDLKDFDNCKKMTEGVDYIFNMACNMGGMGFIENNKTECMLSVLINTNLLRSAVANSVKRYFFSSSACVYNDKKQKDVFIDGLKEEDAYPAAPEDGYGWEKLFSERMCRHFKEDFNLEVRIARYHNVYGPIGTYDGGREKAPAALCRKIIEAKLKSYNSIEVWGDGKQTRSFMYIDDCIIGTKKLFFSRFSEPLNIGSEEQVSINQMIEIIEDIGGIKIKKNHLLDKPLGVRGRSSNNDLAREKINWDTTTSLKDGLAKTYSWIFEQITAGNKNNKYTKKYL